MRRARVRIVGCGVVGTAIGQGLLAHGIDVAFIDCDTRKIDALRQGGLESHPVDDLVRGKVPADISIVAVPTPFEQGRVNLDAVRAAARDVGESLRYLDDYHVVAVKSTVPPGTTESLVIPEVEEYSGKQVGAEFGVCMNPEYLRQASAYDDFMHARLIVIGEYDEHSGDLLSTIYRDFGCPVYRVSLSAAELQKYVHNLYNAAKISFFNEMRVVCAGLGVDAATVFRIVTRSAEGMWNPEYGIRERGPFGGACLPKDAAGFRAWAREQGIDTPLLDAVIQVNDELPRSAGDARQAAD